MMDWVLLPFVLLLSASLGFPYGVISGVVTVTSPVGTILGTVRSITFDVIRYNVKEYSGIPYAEPPVGDKRFRKPLPKGNFIDTFHAFDFGPVCLQKNYLNSIEMASEDCLFLNIFATARSNLSSNIPVMVWIHGGWFQVGSPTSYDAGGSP